MTLEKNDPEKSPEGVDVAVRFQDAGGVEAEFFPVDSDAGGTAIVTESFSVDADGAEFFPIDTGGAAGEFFPCDAGAGNAGAVARSITFGADGAAVDGAVDADDTAPIESFVRDAGQAFSGESGALSFLCSLPLCCSFGFP